MHQALLTHQARKQPEFLEPLQQLCIKLCLHTKQPEPFDDDKCLFDPRWVLTHGSVYIITFTHTTFPGSKIAFEPLQQLFSRFPPCRLHRLVCLHTHEAAVLLHLARPYPFNLLNEGPGPATLPAVLLRHSTQALKYARPCAHDTSLTGTTF